MANSAQQARNIDGSLALVGLPLPHGPVLLVDDMVDLPLDAHCGGMAFADKRQWRGLAAGTFVNRTRPMTPTLSPNTQAILLVTAPLIAGRGNSSSDLLSPGEYKHLVRRLREMQRQPADLCLQTRQQLIYDCRPVVDETRLQRLLGRGFLLSQVVERWQSRAIWVVSRADASYPDRLKALAERGRSGSPVWLRRYEPSRIRRPRRRWIARCK